jgi:hypothetical protein
MTKKSTTRNRNNQPTSKKKEETLLASAVIQEGRDTDILQEDLIREFQPDKFNTDQTFLVNGEWVRFFNQDSSFLKGLMALVNNSTTLRNILNTKTTLTMGDGFVPIEASEVPFLQTLRKMFKKIFIGEAGILEMNNLVGSVNLNNETLEQVIEKVAFDWWAFGNSAVELVQAKRDNKDIVYIYHIPLHKLAIKKVDESNIIKTVGVSDNWNFENGGTSTITEIPLYPEFKQKRSAIHIKNYAPGFFYWGLPGNIASRFWAEIEYRIPKYNIGKFDNGFILSAIIQAYGNMTPEEGKKLVQRFTDTFSGTGNNSKVLFQVLRDEKYKTDVQILEDKSEGRYIELQQLATQAIITGNQWTTSLSGIATGGKLGSNQQIRDELEFVTNTSIKQARRIIMNSIINPFVLENAKVNPALNNMMLKISNLNPISLASNLDPTQVLTRDEQREIFGFEALGNTQQTEEENPIEGEPQSE